MEDKSEPHSPGTRIRFGSDAFKKYLANTSWLFADRIIKLILTLVVGIYLVRYLGPSDFGILSYAISFVALFATIATLGIDSILTRELVKDPLSEPSLLGSSFVLRVIGAIAVLVLLAIAVLITRDDSETVTMIFILGGVTIFQSLFVVDFYFQAKVQAKFTVMVQSAVIISSSLIKLLLIYAQASLLSFVIITAMETVSIGIGFLIMYKAKGGRLFSWHFKKALAVRLLKDSWPLILSGIVVSIYSKIGQIFIKNMLGNEELGYYAAAVRLCEAWYFIPMAASASLFPAIVNAREKSKYLYENRLQKLYDVLAWISIGIAVIVTIFSKEIVSILLGSKFLPSSPVLIIYIWAGVSSFLGVASSQYLIAENKTRLSFYRTLAGMLVNIALNLILIPEYGIIGSAYATLISYTIAVFAIAIEKDSSQQFFMMLKSLFFINFFKFIQLEWKFRFQKSKR